MLPAAISGPRTPHAAARLFLLPLVTHPRPSVRVTAATPHYAVVRFSGAVIESTPASGYLLAQKFSFGWQNIDLSTGNIVLTIPRNASRHGDVGPPADVEAVRAHAAGMAEIIPFVRVIDRYAVMQWWGWGGGENFYKKTAGGWKRFMGGGGSAIVGDLTAKGVPLQIAKALLRQ